MAKLWGETGVVCPQGTGKKGRGRGKRADEKGLWNLVNMWELDWFAPVKGEGGKAVANGGTGLHYKIPPIPTEQNTQTNTHTHKHAQTHTVRPLARDSMEIAVDEAEA